MKYDETLSVGAGTNAAQVIAAHLEARLLEGGASACRVDVVTADGEQGRYWSAGTRYHDALLSAASQVAGLLPADVACVLWRYRGHNADVVTIRVAQTPPRKA